MSLADHLLEVLSQAQREGHGNEDWPIAQYQLAKQRGTAEQSPMSAWPLTLRPSRSRANPSTFRSKEQASTHANLTRPARHSPPVFSSLTARAAHSKSQSPALQPLNGHLILVIAKNDKS